MKMHSSESWLIKFIEANRAKVPLLLDQRASKSWDLAFSMKP
jgi:hypothetical protein